MLSVRVVTVEHCMAKSIPGLTGDTSHQTNFKLEPVIQIFGPTPSGEKVCLNIHGVYPYLYVPYEGGENPDRDALLLAAALDQAMASGKGKYSRSKFVHQVVLVSGIPMYGYHARHRQFFKIYLCNPFHIRRAADLLLSGAILNRKLQPHEAHIPYTLQFMMDFNIYGMSFVHVNRARFRRNPEHPATLSAVSNDLLLPCGVKRSTHSWWEADVLAQDVNNRHHGADPGGNPGIRAIWEDEQTRRRIADRTSQITPVSTQSRPEAVPTASEVMYRERLAAKLNIADLDKTSDTSPPDKPSTPYPAEVPQDASLLEASILEPGRVDPTERDSEVDHPELLNQAILSQMAESGEAEGGVELEEDSVLGRNQAEAEPDASDGEDGVDMTQPLEDDRAATAADEDSQGSDGSGENEAEFWRNMADKLLQLDGADDCSSGSEDDARSFHLFGTSSPEWSDNIMSILSESDQHSTSTGPHSAYQTPQTFWSDHQPLELDALLGGMPSPRSGPLDNLQDSSLLDYLEGDLSPGQARLDPPSAVLTPASQDDVNLDSVSPGSGMEEVPANRTVTLYSTKPKSTKLFNTLRNLLSTDEVFKPDVPRAKTNLTLKEYLQSCGDIVNVDFRTVGGKDMVVIEYKPKNSCGTGQNKFLIKPVNKFLDEWKAAQSKCAVARMQKQRPKVIHGYTGKKSASGRSVRGAATDGKHLDSLIKTLENKYTGSWMKKGEEKKNSRCRFVVKSMEVMPEQKKREETYRVNESVVSGGKIKMKLSKTQKSSSSCEESRERPRSPHSVDAGYATDRSGDSLANEQVAGGVNVNSSFKQYLEEMKKKDQPAEVASKENLPPAEAVTKGNLPPGEAALKENVPPVESDTESESSCEPAESDPGPVDPAVQGSHLDPVNFVRQILSMYGSLPQASLPPLSITINLGTTPSAIIPVQLNLQPHATHRCVCLDGPADSSGSSEDTEPRDKAPVTPTKKRNRAGYKPLNVVVQKSPPSARKTPLLADTVTPSVSTGRSAYFPQHVTQAKLVQTVRFSGCSSSGRVEAKRSVRTPRAQKEAEVQMIPSAGSLGRKMPQDRRGGVIPAVLEDDDVIVGSESEGETRQSSLRRTKRRRTRKRPRLSVARTDIPQTDAVMSSSEEEGMLDVTLMGERLLEDEEDEEVDKGIISFYNKTIFNASDLDAGNTTLEELSVGVMNAPVHSSKSEEPHHSSWSLEKPHGEEVFECSADKVEVLTLPPKNNPPTVSEGSTTHLSDSALQQLHKHEPMVLTPARQHQSSTFEVVTLDESDDSQTQLSDSALQQLHKHEPMVLASARQHQPSTVEVVTLDESDDSQTQLSDSALRQLLKKEPITQLNESIRRGFDVTETVPRLSGSETETMPEAGCSLTQLSQSLLKLQGTAAPCAPVTECFTENETQHSTQLSESLLKNAQIRTSPSECLLKDAEHDLILSEDSRTPTLEGAGGLSCGSRTITPCQRPPTRLHVLSSLTELGIPEVSVQNPFYSDPRDISKAMEIGNRVLKINNYSLAGLKPHKSAQDIRGTEERRDALLNFSKKSHSVRSALVSKLAVTIAPVKKPPGRRQVEDWVDAKKAQRRTPKVEKTKLKVVLPLSPGQLSGSDDDSLSVTPSTPTCSLDETTGGPARRSSTEDTPRAISQRRRSLLGKGKRRLSMLQAIAEEAGRGGDSGDSNASSKDLFLQDKSPVDRESPLAGSRKPNLDSSFQIQGVTLNDTYGFKNSAENLKKAKHTSDFQMTTTLLLEVHVQTRGTLKPDPQHDPLRAVVYHVLHDNATTDTELAALVVGTSTTLLQPLDTPPCVLHYVQDEAALLDRVLALVRFCDPDIIAGYEIQMNSWGYLLQRAYVLGVNLLSSLSRFVVEDTGQARDMDDPDKTDEFDDAPKSIRQLRIPGRVVLDVWRLMRHEVALTSYTFENVMYHVAQERHSLLSYQALSHAWEHPTQRLRHITLQHYLARVLGTARLLARLDLIGRTSELARLFGIQLYEVLSRGSQFRVESMMLRLAKPLNYIPVSPSVAQRASMRAPGSLPLIMEPESKMYTDPVIVLDFQSLYPSMIIAYNYCFSTCLGRVENLGGRDPYEFGCTHLQVPPEELLELQKNVHISPAGVAFVKPCVRMGVLPRMLEEILETRLMVKKAMKEYRGDKTLQKVLHARQLGLKLIANVTYGYTAANFSGRMPCIEVGDSVVSKGRETLQRAIQLVEKTPEWGARVVYGDTDSLFVLTPGRSRAEAFRIGAEIAEAVTMDNPRPVKLKLEKVYQPCILQTKKRYVGYLYESADQAQPVYDAKGIETVRRDGCPATAKILQKALQLLFDTKDVSLVKKYAVRQFSKLQQGRVNLQDLVFAREYRGRQGYRPGACVPALHLARQWTTVDKRAEPRLKERVPYVIVNGPPGLPLIRLVRSPRELLADPSLSINALYYITKAIVPPMQRCFSLLGADVSSWYAEMPRRLHRVLRPSGPAARSTKKTTISQFFSSLSCVACGAVGNSEVCARCSSEPQQLAVVLTEKRRRWERRHALVTKLCESCCGRNHLLDCESLDCPVMFRRQQAEHDMTQVTALDLIMDKHIG